MLKRIFDIISSLSNLILLSPLFMVICVLVKRIDGGPALYRGIRVGYKGKPFRIFKFRTMVLDAEKTGVSSSPDDDPRITVVGKFLRKYKLDELPQLINVLRGEMSLVGPRPQVQWAVDLYNEEERKILNLRPGITDYASVKFANEGEILKGSADPDQTYFEKIHPYKMRLSLEYLEKQSFWLDVKLIVLTLKQLFNKKKD